MPDFNLTTLLQLGPLAVVLIYIIMRLERAMGALAVGVNRMNRILLLLLRRTGMDDEEALALCEGVGRRESDG
ncbi:MAG: hypothetical protein BWY76_02068 [bacterium ADurb.Bin429]|nr:MAG: hypothetical protein BWY76_02068 [bacterium ADurb.Bin429]